MTRRLLALFLILTLPIGGLWFGRSAWAAPVGDTGAPPDLAAWAPWVLHGLEIETCPFRYDDGGDRQCLWPSRLDISVDEKGGNFRQEWLAYAPTWAPLPGGAGQWPEGVEIDGAAAPVVDHEGAPSVRLTPGRYAVTGVFSWDEMPETMTVPAAAGLIRLTIGGREVEFPVWDKSGRLWLQKRAAVEGEEDRLETAVFRLIEDRIPMTARSMLRIDVSGRSREIELAGVLPAGSLPMSLDSPLPARLETDGRLKVQARPGRWEIFIQSRFQGPVDAIGPIEAPFGKEYWSFSAQNHLRMVKIVGAQPIDPGQTDLPEGWREFPAYVMEPGARMVFEVLRRGDPDPAPDRLNLRRTWWLDFDGGGFTIRDAVEGAMSSQWRLDMAEPVELGRVTVDDEDMLITKGSDSGRPGVELRRGQLKMFADSRIDGPLRKVPAVGWDHDFQSVSAELHLPPGWRLVTATGVDVVPGTWFERWTLLDLFIVLIIGMAVFKLAGLGWGFLALVTLALIYHEPGAPKIVWLNLLAASALLRVLPTGWAHRLAHLWRLGSVIFLVVVSIPFIVEQVRVGLFPQLEYAPGQYQYPSAGFGAMNAPYEMDADITRDGASPMPSVMAPPPAPMKRAKKESGGYEQEERQQAMLIQDPNAQIQTGPGVPDWSWRSIDMHWNGPVKKDQQVRLYLLSPTINLILAVLRVIFLTILVVGLIDLRRWWRKLDKGPARSAAAAAALVLVLAPGAGFAQDQGQEVQQIQQMLQMQQMDANAPNQANTPPFNKPGSGTVPSGGPSPVYPPAEMLDELRARLLEPPECLPYCAYFPRLDLEIAADSIRLLIEVHALAETAVPLPGAADSWLPESVSIDDQPAEGIRRDGEGIPWVLVPEGIHRLALAGRTPPGATFKIPMTLRPGRAAIKVDGWDMQGLGDDGRVGASLQFTRLEREGRTEQTLGGSVLPPYLHVERTLLLGLSWRVVTRVTRLTPPGSPVVAAVPLLPGEAVTTAGVRVEKGQAMVNMDARSEEAVWSSTLPITPVIELAAPEGKPWTETWILDASPVWGVDLSGIPVIHHQDSAGMWRPTWRPWPGETVTVRVARPEGIPGRTLTIDSAKLEWTPGQRFNKAGLTVGIRSSQGGQHRITLPEGAELQVVRIDDRTQPIGLEGRTVTVPLQPGVQRIYVEWHEKANGGLIMRSPEVRIGDQAVNAEVVFNLPDSRWILWTGGPRLGPAVLFWSYVIVVILAALALGRIRWTPLKTRHWLLLGLGLTQVHPLMAMVVVGWLLVLGLRERQGPGHWLVFDLAQIGLAFWTAIALVFLYLAVEEGLLGIPQMQISGNGSSAYQLNWTMDRIDGSMPRPWLISLPRLAFNGLMLLWAVWLAVALMGWLRWGWRSFTEEALWKRPPKSVKKAAETPAPGTEFKIE